MQLLGGDAMFFWITRDVDFDKGLNDDALLLRKTG